MVQHLAGQGQPLKEAMAELRRCFGGGAVIVVGHAVQHDTGRNAVLHGYAAHIAAALGGGLDLDARQRVCKVAVPDLHILHAAAHLAADADAVAAVAAAVKHPDVGAGAADFIALGVLAALDGHGIVPRKELAGKQCAVRRGVGVPAVPVPDALRHKGAVVGLDIVAVDHVDIPRRAVFEGDAADPDIFTVAQVDKAGTHAAGDRVAVLAAFDQFLIVIEEALDARTLILDDLAGQRLAAAADRALAADDDVAAVRPGLVVQLTGVEQAGIAAHLDPLKPAGDARGVVMDVGGALQHSALGKVDFKIAVQPQRTGQKITRRDIENIVRAAVVDGALQIVGVQQLAVTAAEVGRSGNVDSVLFLPELQRGGADAIAAADHIHPEGAAVGQALDRKVGLVGAADGLAVEGDRVLRPARRSGGLIPVQHRVILGAAYI